MKSSRTNQAISTDTKIQDEVRVETVPQGAPAVEPSGFRAVVRRFKHDLRAPLPGTEELSRWGKIKARFVHLARRYGWKLLVAVIVYYLIRDSLLYIVIPYLIARHFID
jgi:hypothetical protein